MNTSDPLLSSMMAHSATKRVALLVCALGCLWLAIAWAVALP